MSDVSINDISSFQQTQSARVRDPGVPVNANPPPPPPDPSKKLQQEPSPHPTRGQNVNFTI